MKKTFSINAKGTVINLLQSIALPTNLEQKTVSLFRGDPVRSCVNMVATKRPEISLA
jgi:hypothetical protein